MSEPFYGVCVLQAWQSFPHSEYQCRSSQAVIATALQQMASGGGGGSPGRAASAGQEGGATHEGAGPVAAHPSGRVWTRSVGWAKTTSMPRSAPPCTMLLLLKGIAHEIMSDSEKEGRQDAWGGWSKRGVQLRVPKQRMLACYPGRGAYYVAHRDNLPESCMRRTRVAMTERWRPSYTSISPHPHTDRLSDIGFSLTPVTNTTTCTALTLPIKLTIWSDEGYAPTYHNPHKPWEESFVQVVEKRQPSGILTGYRVYLLPQAFRTPCDPKLNIICSNTGNGTSGHRPPWSRTYTIDVTATNAAGVGQTSTLTVPVLFTKRRRQLMSATGAEAGSLHQQHDQRELHPGATSDGRQFKIVEVTGVLGAV